jgi:uncharacterized membrane protein
MFLKNVDELRRNYVPQMIALLMHNVALTSTTSGGRSVGIVRSWTEATEFSFFRPSNGCSSKALLTGDFYAPQSGMESCRRPHAVINPTHTATAMT